jgi:NADPH:quinone reductase-like Zn-dependent oxidoreductase
VAETSELARIPDNLSWEEAATVPISALTAWQALFVHAGLNPPTTSKNGGNYGGTNATKRILITAAAGGVGLWAVQLARLAGVGYIVGTCGTDNVDFVRSLGAHEVVDYKKVTDLASIVSDETSKFDLVLDCVGGTTLDQAWHCARVDDGMVISVAQPAEPKRPAGAERVATTWFIVVADPEQLTALAKLLEDGSCKTFVDSVYALEDYEKAFSKLHSGHLRGKVVLRINHDD